MFAPYSGKSLHIKLLILVMLLLPGKVIFAQEQSETPKKVVNETKTEAISINDISAESEKLGLRIFKLRTILEPSSKILEVVSLLDITGTEINLKRDTLLMQVSDMSKRRLKVQTVEWENYKSDLKGYQSILQSRLDNVSKTNKELVEELKKWSLTKETIGENKESGEMHSSLDNIIISLQEVVDISLVRLDSIFLIQKDLTHLILTVDEVISEIHRVEVELQKEYFIFDSPSLWKYNEIDSVASDTTQTFAQGEPISIKIGFFENMVQAKNFLEENVKTAILQAIFILFLLVLLFALRRKWSKTHHNPDNKIEREAEVILKHPFSSTIAVGLLISAFFYKSLIPIFSEIHIVIILAATTYLLPRLTTKRFSFFLLLLWTVYLLTSMEVYLNPNSLLVRFLLLLDALILITALITGRRQMRKTPEQFTRIRGLFKLVVPFYILFLVVALIGNLIGMVNFSRFLVVGVMSSTTLGIVVFFSIKIITSLIVLLFKIQSSANPKAFSTMVKVTQKRIKPILLFVGLIVWFWFTLMSFEVYNYLLEYIKELLLIDWEVGQMVISLGGILSFSGIFIIAILIAKLGAAIFEDEWMINVLPRGIAPAISLLLRIIIITIGLYVALSAAGLDLSKLGFIVGALGVGIGFGLQNVVLNFIAGLILAFERPINLGDSIEVDSEFGVVTNIGVRSSNIKTYSGSEAIIPNGDLISKKVVNWTLSNRDRRSKILMKTSANADPEEVIKLLNKIASEHPKIVKKPAPITHFHGFNEEGNLSFALYFWTTFSDTWNTEPELALTIYKELKENGIQAPIPMRKIISGDNPIKE